MDYRILGPLEVCQGGRTVRLGGDKRRALLAILLLHAGEVVSAERLIDELWGERPPPTALKALQVHISRLRRALDGDRASPNGVSDGVLVTRGHGYLLAVGTDEPDLDRFRDVVEEGRRTLAAGDADQAARLLRDALMHRCPGSTGPSAPAPATCHRDPDTNQCGEDRQRSACEPDSAHPCHLVRGSRVHSRQRREPDPEDGWKRLEDGWAACGPRCAGPSFG